MPQSRAADKRAATKGPEERIKNLASAARKEAFAILVDECVSVLRRCRTLEHFAAEMGGYWFQTYYREYLHQGDEKVPPTAARFFELLDVYYEDFGDFSGVKITRDGLHDD